MNKYLYKDEVENINVEGVYAPVGGITYFTKDIVEYIGVEGASCLGIRGDYLYSILCRIF